MEESRDRVSKLETRDTLRLVNYENEKVFKDLR